MSEHKFQQEEGQLPSYIYKDQMAFELLFQAIRNIEKTIFALSEGQSNNAREQQTLKTDLMKEINEIKLQNASMSGIDPNDVRESISWMKSSKKWSAVLVPIFLLMVLGLSLIGLKQWVNDPTDRMPSIPKPTSYMILPNNSMRSLENRWSEFNKG
jgi:hypothetical protein